MSMGLLDQIKVVQEDYEADHQDGIPWHEAVLPFRLHRCRAQTSGWVEAHIVERCACGAVSIDRSAWNFKNERRRRVPRF